MASGKNKKPKNKSSKYKYSNKNTSKNTSTYNASNNKKSNDSTSLGMKIVIIIFAVVLVAGVCLPFISSCSTTSSTTETTTATTTTTTTTSTGDTSTVAGVQQNYATLLESLENRVAEDPTNLTNLASLANNYMDCAFEMYEADDWAAYEDEINDLFSSAVSYYALYRALAEGDDSVSQDSINAVTVDEAVCRYYTGDAEQAIDMITTLLADQPHYTMGWYNLGAIYEQEGDYEDAAEAFYTVLDLDPNDETGANTNATYQLFVMELNGWIGADDTDEEADTDEAADTEEAVDTDEEADIDEEADAEEAADTDESDTATE